MKCEFIKYVVPLCTLSVSKALFKKQLQLHPVGILGTRLSDEKYVHSVTESLIDKK